MTKAKKNDTKTNRVTIVDNKLILSLPDAETPVVWQLDLLQAQSAGFSVEEDKKKKTYALALKKTDGASEQIAVYKEKDEAVALLMETSDVLQGTTTATQSSGNHSTHAQNDNAADQAGSDKVGALLALSLVIILIGIWILSASGSLSSIEGDSYSDDIENATQAAASNPRESSGVPVSADDFLNNR